MSYLIYNKQTTVTIKDKYHISTQRFATEGAARGAVTRLVNKGKIKREDYAIASVEDFRKIEKQETRRNLMSGKEFTQSVNTPRCCDPSSETYWSM